MKDLHDAIMRIPCDVPSRFSLPNDQFHYVAGYLDAIQAAAELAIAAPKGDKSLSVASVSISHWRGIKSMENVEFQLHRDMPDGTHLLYTEPQAQPAIKAEFDDAEFLTLAHRMATTYAHRSDPTYHSYAFVPHTLIAFCRAVLAARDAK